MDELKVKDINDFSEMFHEDSKNKLAQHAIRKAKNVSTVLMDTFKSKEFNDVFSHAIHVDVENSDQGSSGRCWLFAILSIIRLNMIQNYKLDNEFELSQAYPFFWDQFEKSNYFLRNIIKYRKKEIDNEYNRQILSDPVSDGGNWNMAVNIISKYGLVPKNDMDETFHTSHTEQMKDILNNKLREFAVELRKMPDRNFEKDKSVLEKRLKEMMYTVFKILTIYMGTPPETVNWSFYQNITGAKKKGPSKKQKQVASRKKKKRSLQKRKKVSQKRKKVSKKRKKVSKKKKKVSKKKGGSNNKSKKKNKKKKSKKSKKKKTGKRKTSKIIKRKTFPIKKNTSYINKSYSVIRNILPTDFYKNHIKYKCEDKLVLINFPHKKRPYNKRFTIKLSNNMENDNDATYVNVPIEVLMKAAAKSIAAGEAVWFGCDVGKNIHHINGIMDPDSINHKETLGTELELDKGNSLFTKAGEVNHAMVLKGFNMENNNINKWWVENSWGDENDNLGNYVMSSNWFKKHVYEVVVDKKYCDKKTIALFKQDAIELEPWDPFGNLLLK